MIVISEEIYREGNGGTHYINLYLRAYLWSGVDPPRGQGHMVGKGISTQLMMSSHTYDVISTLDQYKRGNNPGTFHILNGGLVNRKSAVQVLR